MSSLNLEASLLCSWVILLKPCLSSARAWMMPFVWRVTLSECITSSAAKQVIMFYEGQYLLDTSYILQRSKLVNKKTQLLKVFIYEALHVFFQDLLASLFSHLTGSNIVDIKFCSPGSGFVKMESQLQLTVQLLALLTNKALLLTVHCLKLCYKKPADLEFWKCLLMFIKHCVDVIYLGYNNTFCSIRGLNMPFLHVV